MSSKKFLDLSGLDRLLSILKNIFYKKPNEGIPKTDLEQDVQTTLTKSQQKLIIQSIGIPNPLTVENNHEYHLSNVVSQIIYIPKSLETYKSSIRLHTSENTEKTLNIKILPASNTDEVKYIGEAPIFSHNEIWKIDVFSGGIVQAEKVGDGTSTVKITIDDDLNPNSNNPVKNSSIYTALSNKKDNEKLVTSGTDIILENNAEYRLDNVTSLNLTFPNENFECWMRIETAQSGNVSIQFPQNAIFVGDEPVFNNDEIWEISIKDKIVMTKQINNGIIGIKENMSNKVSSWSDNPDNIHYPSEKLVYTSIPKNLSDLNDDSTHRTVTDNEKTSWSNKSDFSGNYNDLTNKPTLPDVSNFITKNVNDLTYYYTKTEIDGKVFSVYKYKGSVSTYANLPNSNLTAGDVYNVETDGSNYAWTGTIWDKLGGDIDLSGYQEKINSTNKLSIDNVSGYRTVSLNTTDNLGNTVSYELFAKPATN